MRTLYFDCFSGISGDMTIGALLDAGLDFGYLRSELSKLPVDGYQLNAHRVVRANLSAMKFDVVIGSERALSPDHHHHDHPHTHEHAHGHEHGHEHHEEPNHGRHDHSGYGHFHRKASEILSMIENSGLQPQARRMAVGIFTKLAISEGKVHDMPPEDVSFHEVGAIDSIVDVVGAAIGFEALGIERFVCSPINVGGGFIHCQHGVFPSPSPATADLLRQATVYSKHVSKELVTPTGAAILAAVVQDFSGLGGLKLDHVGYGAGTRQFQDFPNCLRIMIGDDQSASVPVSGHPDRIDVIETNIDDANPQNLAYLMDRLLDAGALDVSVSPVVMKKGRSGQRIQILSPLNLSQALTRMVFEETPTLGVRSYSASRTVLEREIVEVQTPLGRIRVKVSLLEGRVVNAAPEYDDCVRVAQEHRRPLKEVQALALKEYQEHS